MSLGLVAALAAPAAYGTATVWQAQAVAQVDVGGGLLRQLVRDRRYAAGLGLDLVGFAAAALALQSEPLFLVQAALAASTGVTVLLAWAVLGTVLSRRDVLALIGLGSGLVLMAASASSGPAVHGGTLLGLALLLGVLPLAGVTARGGSGAWLAVVAGLAGGASGIAARALAIPDPPWQLLASPGALAVAGYGAVCAWAFAEALARTSVAAATATCFAVSTVLPAVVGLVVLGDHVRAGWAVPAAAGIAAVLGTTALLARQAPHQGRPVP